MEGAVVALEVDGEGVVAADEGEVVCAAAVAEVETVDGSGVPVADMFAGIGRRVKTVVKEIRPELDMVEGGKGLR